MKRWFNRMNTYYPLLFLTVVFALTSAGAFGQITFSDDEWLFAWNAGQKNADCTSIADVPGDPGLSITIDKSTSDAIDIIWIYGNGSDWSARGTTFQVELENPNATGFNINAYVQSNSWSNWDQHWQWLGAGESVVYTVTITDPTSVDKFGFQMHSADPGQYTLKIVGGPVDFNPTDPVPEEGSELGVHTGGNILSWVNHSPTYPETGDDVTCDVYIGIDPETLLTEPNYLFEDLMDDQVTVELAEGNHYYWTVHCSVPDGVGGTIEEEGPVWEFDAVMRSPMTKYEAEDSVIVAGTEGDNPTAPELRDDQDASGGQAIWSNWGGTDRGSFYWMVKAAQAGTYDMTIHYRVGGTSERGEKIYVNGMGDGSDVMFPGTEDVYSDLTVQIDLEEGENEISFVTSWGGITYDYFVINMDDLTATHPDPAIDEVVLVNGNTLNWRKHSALDPVKMLDVTCNVYMGTSEPNMLNPDPNDMYWDYELDTIAIDTEASTVPVTLDWGNTYYWIVDSIASIDGEPTLFPGYVWTFTTIDPAPEIDMDESITVKRTVTYTLDPVVTDLGKPGIAYAWTLDAGPEGVTIDDICGDPTAENPEFIFDVLEPHTLTLTVTDESENVTSASIEVTVIEYFRALRLEAEDARIVTGQEQIDLGWLTGDDPNSPQIQMRDDASANRVAWTNWSGSPRGGIAFTIVPPAAGTYEMVIRYSTTETSVTRADKLFILNDESTRPDWPDGVEFPGTDGVLTDLVKMVNLAEGENEIHIETSWGGMTYDYIEFPFIEAPRAAYDPSPEDWESVPTNLSELGWVIDPNSAESVITSTVYIGTNEPNMAEPDYDLEKYDAATSTSTPMPIVLTDDTTYYWLVEYTDSDLAGETFLSEAWQFTAIPPCEYWGLMGDLNMDCTVDTADLQILAEAWLVEETGYFLPDFAEVSGSWKVSIDPVTGEPVVVIE